MAKKKQTATKPQEQDGVFVLKLVLYLVIGAQWVWIHTAADTQIPLPVGLVIGILFAMHDHFQIDRKIEYAVLLVAMLLGFVASIGVFVTL